MQPVIDYKAPRELLAGKVVLVTGAGDGIGRVVARSYAAHGATVLLLGRTVPKLESAYDDIMTDGSPEPAIVPMDLATAAPADMQTMVAAINEQHGRLDGLLHNASILGDRVPVEHYDLNLWMKVMHVNFNAVFLMTRLCMPLLRAAPRASMVFTSSSVGARPRAYWGAYAVSKYAMEGLAHLLADEMDTTSEIRFNILNPGATRTAMRAAAYPGEDPATVKQAADLLPLYLYLMGDDSSDQNGQTFTP